MARVARLEVGGHSIAYGERGEGPPLVLLHGWPLDSREWTRQLHGLSDEFRVLAWDAPGAGASSDPPAGSRLADWAAWLAEFMATLDLGPCHVGGLSWGGGLALELYRRHPEMIRSLILISAYAGWGGSLPADVVEQRLQLMRHNSELSPDRWAPGLIGTLVASGAAPELADELTAMISALHPAATRTALEAFAAADLRDVLAGIEVPTLLLCGELDIRAPRDVWEPLHSAIPGARLVVIPDVGHMVDLEAPERCNQEIRHFLRAVPS